MSNLSDRELSKSDITKKFTVGGHVRARVIGFRLIDGMSAVSLKESVLAQQASKELLEAHWYSRQ